VTSREHHGGAGANQQVGGETDRGIGGDAGNDRSRRIAIRPRGRPPDRFRGARFEYLQPPVRHPDDAVDDFAETVRLFVLHPDDIGIAHAGRGHAFGQQQFGLQLLAAETDDHHLAAEIRIARQILQGPDRYRGAGGVDGDTAAIDMGHRHDVVDVRIFRQQLLADALDAYSTVPATHCTLVEIRQDVAGPAEPSALR